MCNDAYTWEVRTTWSLHFVSFIVRQYDSIRQLLSNPILTLLQPFSYRWNYSIVLQSSYTYWSHQRPDTKSIDKTLKWKTHNEKMALDFLRLLWFYDRWSLGIVVLGYGHWAFFSHFSHWLKRNVFYLPYSHFNRFCSCYNAFRHYIESVLLAHTTPSYSARSLYDRLQPVSKWRNLSI